ncbi:hypothetical protein [Caballeronia telluris]|uniref:hypothetical protein n=1 Tax=Caballeronia telluris TaxID=326475 RepID=UPI000A58E003|nr:hypothetical protein [Caballeronia telluris]
MKPFEPLSPGGRGWRIAVDELAVDTREGTRRPGIELDWRRADFEAWSMREP